MLEAEAEARFASSLTYESRGCVIYVWIQGLHHTSRAGVPKSVPDSRDAWSTSKMRETYSTVCTVCRLLKIVYRDRDRARVRKTTSKVQCRRAVLYLSVYKYIRDITYM